MPLKLLIVDDHALIREAVRHVVATLDAGQRVGRSRLRARLCAGSRRTPSLDLLLLDFHLAALHGVAAIRAWRQRFPTLPVVVLSSAEDRATVLAAMNAGAAGSCPNRPATR